MFRCFGANVLKTPSLPASLDQAFIANPQQRAADALAIF